MGPVRTACRAVFFLLFLAIRWRAAAAVMVCLSSAHLSILPGSRIAAAATLIMSEEKVRAVPLISSSADIQMPSADEEAAAAQRRETCKYGFENETHDF